MVRNAVQVSTESCYPALAYEVLPISLLQFATVCLAVISLRLTVTSRSDGVHTSHLDREKIRL